MPRHAAQVLLRYFFSAPLFWAEQISVQLLVFITLMLVLGMFLEGISVLIMVVPLVMPVGTGWASTPSTSAWSAPWSPWSAWSRRRSGRACTWR